MSQPEGPLNTEPVMGKQFKAEMRNKGGRPKGSVKARDPEGLILQSLQDNLATMGKLRALIDKQIAALSEGMDISSPERVSESMKALADMAVALGRINESAAKALAAVQRAATPTHTDDEPELSLEQLVEKMNG